MPAPTRFFAHSAAGLDPCHWQLLDAHLLAVGQWAGGFARVFGAEALGIVLGQLHDLGKYTEPFQARLRGSLQRVDHSTWGARMACERFGPYGQLLAYAIAGHHAGLANGQGGGERTALADRLAADLPALAPAWRQEIALPAALASPKGFKPYGQDHTQAKERAQFQFSFLVRMLFSCLVDADFLDTEAYYARIDPAERHRLHRHAPTATLEQLRERLETHLGGWKSCKSRPTWARGLKPPQAPAPGSGVAVAPYVGACTETDQSPTTS